MKNGHSWQAVEKAGQGALASITSAVFILLAVGALIGVWNLSGTIPTLVYYGIQALSPSWYYAASALICGAIAMSIGSSWTTAGTIGVGLVGIAQMVGVDVHEHIKRQAWTSVPAFVIAFVVLLIVGLLNGPDVQNPVGEELELNSLDGIYNITPLALLPLLLLGYLSIRRVPATLALLAAALFAGVLAVFLQPSVMHDFGGGGVVGAIKGIWLAMANGFSIDTGIGEIDRLLSRGGMDSMLTTLWLIIGAVTFGALLEEFGLIARLVDPLIHAAKSTGRLFATVFGCAFGLNVVAGDQYIALVLPSRVFRAEFARRGLAATNLSRLAADSGTVTSPLVPWNSCGAFMGAVLGVATLSYLPYAIFNYASPALSVLYGITGFRVERTGPVVEESVPGAAGVT
jgi:NhaC family Na+:H+ antiporter